VIEQQGHVKEIIGDSFYALFQHTTDALNCAITLQQTLRDNPIHLIDCSGNTHTLQVRIAIYRADVEVFVEPSSNELIHLELSRAARFASMKPFSGGQILVSEEARARAANRDDYQWHPWPYRRIKDFEQPANVYELLWDGVSRGEPGVRALPDGLEQEIKRYVRRPEQARIVGWLTPDQHSNRATRLVTLRGFGGMGKTRLAIECALSLTPWFEDGLYLVRLDYLESRPDKMEAVLESIGRAIQPDAPLNKRETIFVALRDRKNLLLLDNYESVQCDGVRDLLSELLEECLSLCLLVTGRVPVGIDGVEQEETITGMEWEQARELFVDRTRRRRPDWTPTPAEEGYLQEIMTLISSIPLAIELTAAQIHPKTVLEVLESLKKSPLGAMVRHRPGHRHSDPSPRHDSLQACIDWSFNLLRPEQQTAFAQLGIFADSFNLSDVEAVCGMDDEMLISLHEASLVDSYAYEGRSRYTFLPVIRAYAVGKFAALSEAEAIRERYIHHYTQLASDNDDAKRAVLTAAWRNAISTAEVAEQRDDWQSVCELSYSLSNFLLPRGMRSECEQLNLRALNAARDANQPEYEHQIIGNLANIYRLQGRWKEVRTHYEQILPIFHESGDKDGEGITLNHLGIIYQEQGDFGKAITHYKQSLKMKLQLRDERGAALALANIGTVYRMQGRPREAIDCFKRSLPIFQHYGDSLDEERTLTSLGNAYGSLGHWPEANICYEDSLAINWQLGHKLGAGYTLANMAVLNEEQGNIPAALIRAREALQVLEETEDRRMTERVRGWIAMWEQRLDGNERS
jgi:predicted ATPase